MVSPCREENRRFEHEEAACGSRQGRETPGRQHRKALYTELQITGKLNGYLADLNKQAVSVFLELVKQMAEREGVTELLKAQDQMQWVQRMNSIRDWATEIVNNDLIYA